MSAGNASWRMRAYVLSLDVSMFYHRVKHSISSGQSPELLKIDSEIDSS